MPMAGGVQRNGTTTASGEENGLWERLLDQMGVEQTSNDASAAPPEPAKAKNGRAESLWSEPNRKAETAKDKAAADKKDQADFENQLREIAQTKGAISTGKIQILNIKPVAKHFGAKWPSVAERAHRMIGNILKAHLGPKDIWRRHEEFIYIVVFADFAAEEARGRVALIGEDIREKLIGEEPGLAQLELQSASYTMDGKLILSNFSGADAIDDLVDTGDSIDLSGKDDSRNGGMDAAAAEDAQNHSHTAPLSAFDALNERLEEVKRAHAMIADRLQNHYAHHSSDARNASPEYRMLSGLEDELLRLHDRLARRVPLMPSVVGTDPNADGGHDAPRDVAPPPTTLLLMAAENGLMQGDTDTRTYFDALNKTKLIFTYRPAWHVGSSIIGTHFAAAYFQEGDEFRAADVVIQRRMNEDICALLDRCLLRRALADLIALEDVTKSLVSVPVHYSTLRHVSHRETHQYLMHSIPRWFRDYLIWEVLAAPRDMMRSQIDEITNALLPFGQTVLWRSTLFGGNLKPLSGTRVRGVGIHLHEKRIHEDRLSALMEKWVSQAKRYGLNTYIRGADSVNLVNKAASVGFDRIAGDAIRPKVDIFGGASPFSADNLMNHPAFHRNA